MSASSSAAIGSDSGQMEGSCPSLLDMLRTTAEDKLLEKFESNNEEIDDMAVAIARAVSESAALRGIDLGATPARAGATLLPVDGSAAELFPPRPSPDPRAGPITPAVDVAAAATPRPVQPAPINGHEGNNSWATPDRVTLPRTRLTSGPRVATPSGSMPVVPLLHRSESAGGDTLLRDPRVAPIAPMWPLSPPYLPRPPPSLPSLVPGGPHGPLPTQFNRPPQFNPPMVEPSLLDIFPPLPGIGYRRDDNYRDELPPRQDFNAGHSINHPHFAPMCPPTQPALSRAALPPQGYLNHNPPAPRVYPVLNNQARHPPPFINPTPPYPPNQPPPAPWPPAPAPAMRAAPPPLAPAPPAMAAAGPSQSRAVQTAVILITRTEQMMREQLSYLLDNDSPAAAANPAPDHTRRAISLIAAMDRVLREGEYARERQQYQQPGYEDANRNGNLSQRASDPATMAADIPSHPPVPVPVPVVRTIPALIAFAEQVFRSQMPGMLDSLTAPAPQAGNGYVDGDDGHVRRAIGLVGEMDRILRGAEYERGQQ